MEIDQCAVLCSGVVSANDTTDFTVKIDATGLRPDTRYFFAFASGQTPEALVGCCTLSIQQAVSQCHCHAPCHASCNMSCWEHIRAVHAGRHNAESQMLHLQRLWLLYIVGLVNITLAG